MAQLDRHSTVVAWAKIVLPAVALVLLSSLFLFASKPDPDAALPFADLDVDQVATEQRLSEPRFASTLEDGREVVVNAASVVQTSDATNEIALDQVHTTVELATEDSADIVARDGLVDLGERLVRLNGDVTLDTLSGYHMFGQLMFISMDDAFRLWSPEEVFLEGPGFQLQAGAMELVGPEGLAVLEFTDGVRLLYGTGE